MNLMTKSKIIGLKINKFIKKKLKMMRNKKWKKLNNLIGSSRTRGNQEFRGKELKKMPY